MQQYQRHLIEIDPQRIKFNPLNPRKHRGTELIRLRASIKSIGIVQLPTVRILPGDFYEVIDGEGRVSIAQEEHFEKIWVVSVGIIGEQEALMMLQSANTMRSYNFLAECRGLANLHRQKKTNTELAKQFGISEGKATTMVAIGHIPPQSLRRVEEDITTSEQHSDRWTYAIFESILPLREFLPGKSASNAGQWTSLDDLYDYREVDKAIEMVRHGDITSSSVMSKYVAERKFEIFQERFDQDLHKRLEEELIQTKKDLEKIKEKQVYEVEERIQRRYEQDITLLEHQKDDLAKRNSHLVNEIAKRPEHVAQREVELERDLQQAAKERQALHDERTKLEDEIYRERKRLQQEAIEKQEKLAQESSLTLKGILDEQKKEYERILKEKSKETEEDLKSFYEQKDKERQIKAENTIRGLISFGTKSLAETQQTIEHIISDGMIQSVQMLGGAQQESLLWSIRSMQEALQRAETKLTYGDIVRQVEGEFFNGHKA